jgi:hypothetical protein
MIAQPSHASYRWTTDNIALAYNVAQNVTNFGEYNILREDNINNVAHFAMTKPMTDHDVRAFFKKDESIVGFMSLVNYHMFMIFLRDFVSF